MRKIVAWGAALACLALGVRAQSPSAANATSATTQPAPIVKAQASFAAAHLRGMSASMSANPEGAFSNQALANGWVQAPKRPSLNESIDSSFAMVEAGLRSCPAVPGPCQDEALAAGRRRGQAVRSAKSPAAEMRKQMAQLDEWAQAPPAKNHVGAQPNP